MAKGQISPSSFEDTLNWDFLDSVSRELVEAGITDAGADHIAAILDRVSEITRPRLGLLSRLTGGRLVTIEDFSPGPMVTASEARVDPLVKRFFDIKRQYETWSSGLSSRQRWPIVLGIVLVLAGFIFQVAGSVPTGAC